MKAELKPRSINQVAKGADIYEAGDFMESIAMVIKGRIRVHGYGINVVVGSGSFLGLRDLARGAHGVTCTAQTNASIYVFPVSGSMSDLKQIIEKKKDYGALMVVSLTRSLAEQEKIYEALQDAAEEGYRFISRTYQECQAIAGRAGVSFERLPSVEGLYPFDEPQILALDKIRYYQASAKIPMDIQKAFYGASDEICLYHVREVAALIHHQHTYCRSLTEYLEQIMKIYVIETKNFCISLINFVGALQRSGQDAGGAMKCLDDLIDHINQLEVLLQDKANVTMELNRGVMEQKYFSLLHPGGGQAGDTDDELVHVENAAPDVSVLKNSMEKILAYGEIDTETVNRFMKLVKQFEGMSDKASTSDVARALRRGLLKDYYQIYLQVFLKDYLSQTESPITVDLFLRYGFLSERLLKEELLVDLLSIDRTAVNQNGCQIFDMKEWLQAIVSGEREPSKNEYDLDYEEFLREKLKNKEITDQEQKTLQRDQMKKLAFEVDNMFRVNHRLANGQISTFVPFLYTDGCLSSLEKSYLSKEKVSAAFNRLRRIDFSVFFREKLYEGELPVVGREFIQVEVCPDIILMPTVGTKDIMWQELSGRKRDTPGRFLMPAFLEADLDKCVAHLGGSFRWELCRTMQGAYWNNIQYKSLTSEYSDFLQFYRKNKELSNDRKEKVKLQIQKYRNNSREIFASDYVSWIRQESRGGMILNKPVREILATYCPFTAEIRQSLEGQPMFQNAMARHRRESAKKRKEYDIKFRMWQNEKFDVPPEIMATMYFYTEL